VQETPTTAFPASAGTLSSMEFAFKTATVLHSSMRIHPPASCVLRALVIVRSALRLPVSPAAATTQW
jgi:hypothetical protein